MKTDNLVMHSEDVQEVVEEFYGSPIRAVRPFKVELRAIDEMQQRVRASFGLDSPVIEPLPGEVVKGNVIRRSTAAEVVGEKFYEPAPQVPFEENISCLKEPDYWDDYTARCA